MRLLAFTLGFTLAECFTGLCLAQQGEVYEYEHSSNDGVGYQEIAVNDHYREFAPIHMAAMRGDIETIRAELAEGVPVDLKVEDLHYSNTHRDATPLMWAVSRGKPEAARFLIKAGADINAKAKYGITPLMVAIGTIPTIGSDLLPCVKILIEAGADIETSDGRGRTAMFYACGDASPLEYPRKELLTEKYRIESMRSYIRPHFGGAIGLSWLVPNRVVRSRQGDAHRLATLIEAGANANARNRNGKTILMQAASTSDSQRIRLLLDAGADFTPKTKYGWNALLVAALYGNSEMFAQLLTASIEANNINLDKNGGDLLCKAASSEEDADQKVRLLLDAGADPNSLGRNGRRPLLSSFGGRAATILLEAGADPTVFDRKGNSALILAARSGSADALKMLLEHNFDIERRSNERLQPTALILAARSHHESSEKIKLLLEAGAEIDIKLRDGTTALLIAARTGNMNAMQVLTTAGADVNVVDGGPIKGENGSTYREGQKGMTPLMYVANRGASSTFLCKQTGEDAVQSLLAHGAEVDIATPSGETALIFSIRSEHPKAVQLLLDAGANPSVVSTEWWDIEWETRRSALGVAIDFENPNAVEMLLNAGADSNAIAEISGINNLPALCLAAMAGDILSVRSLLNDGAQIDTPDSVGLTPLMHAFNADGWFRSYYESQQLNTTQFLLDKGANVNAADNIGRTVLMYALDSGVSNRTDDAPSLNSLIQRLLDLGANLEARDKELMTPLMYAAMSHVTDRIKILIDAGADLDAIDNKGRNALAMARGTSGSYKWQIPSLEYIEQLYKQRDK
ncbi:MAG: ankyrin repeat domain-containing protein [Planctomycetes bacterium]|nr:ankyrin repeat domain-containing protein [Planctomycetota bacterium]